MFHRYLTVFARGRHTFIGGMELSAIKSALEEFAPPSLAGSWDNVGLLIEPTPPHMVEKMILTNDLTQAVMDEAVSQKANMILSYHPPIFAPLKRLTQGKWKERITIQCIENRIALYSPHTSFDAVKGGVNDWLIEPFGGEIKPLETVYQPTVNTIGKFRIDVSFKEEEAESCLKCIRSIENVEITSTFSYDELGKRMVRVQSNANATGLTALVEFLNKSHAAKKTMEIIELKQIPIPNQGAGRFSKLDEAVKLSAAVDMVKSHLKLSHVRLAKAAGAKEDPTVRSVAVCAGSGGSLLRGVTADLYITGEMSHHEVLDAVQNDHSVILCDHSNTERGFLSVLRSKLTTLFDNQVQVILSERDADPLQVV